MNWNELNNLPTPCYIIDERQLICNGRIIKKIQEKTGAKILLAQKAFSCYDLYPTLEPFLAGTEASGLFEARLGYEYLNNKEVHIFSAAYKKEDFGDILQYAGHIVFNSPRQLELYGFQAKSAGKSIGLRINPECSTQDHAIYDPCSPGSRLGTTKIQWDRQMTPDLIALLDGLHFHTLCEQGFEPLERTFKAVEEKWGEYLSEIKWLNMGGGHYITHQNYDVPALIKFLNYIHEKYNLQVYMEPGEAFVLNAGYILTTVLDLPVNGETNICLVDASAACHMPDVIEMPYSPPIVNAKKAGELCYTYRIGSQTCLAGDVVGDYSFDHQLIEGEKLAFADMAYYTMCKSNTFNGMPLPSIYVVHTNGNIELLKSFGYDDFKYRLGK